jgi:pilus assembly protein CpaB
MLLLGLAALGAAGVFALVSNYVAEVRAEVEPKTTVLRLAADAKPFQPLAPGDVDSVEMPERWAPASALTEPSELGGLVPATRLEAGSIIQRGMLIPEPTLRSGQREVAILVDAETGVAGKISPGSSVDIFATFPNSDGTGGRSEIVVEAARVIDVGLPRERDPELPGTGEDDAHADAHAAPPEQGGAVVPVTFALSVEESLVLVQAESFAEEVRLGLVSPGSDPIPSRQDRSFEG